ncbi:histidinol-phosphatase [Calderihabitans maritimus]|uniref:Histidinol-phosphatase n=1 Tax=Calderihabitans maritimus TaxID=1246530 RepID=A0A1Z5HUQ8_9FIRM|nr:histidinol-phosphatase [Calderihabitans maritimus]GAW93065.1 HisJ family histidinol phosphate phosphatase [Calderihabitans maritimus]
MLVDYHIHPDFSYDAEGTVEEYCAKAVEMGFEEICFTPHYESDPCRQEIDGFARVEGKLVPITSDWLTPYFDAVRRAAHRFKDHLKVKVGLEVDHIPERESDLRQVIESYPFDFVLGAVHSLDHIAISSRNECFTYFERKEVWELWDDYFDILRDLVESGLYDAVAHLDVYKRHGLRYYPAEEICAVPPQAEKLLEAIARRGMVIEVNTSGFRQGIDQSFPSIDLIKLAADKGVKLFTLGSDAHRLKELGQGIRRGKEIIHKLGLGVVTFSRRSIERIAG